MVKALLIFSLPFAQCAFASIFDGEVSTPTSIHHLLDENTTIVADFGISYIHPEFKDIKNVKVENTQISTQDRVGDVISDYPDQFAQILILQGMLNRESAWTASIKTVLPINSLAQLDTGSIYQPEFVLYRAQFQRPQIIIFTGFNPTERLRVGGGVEVGFNATTQAHLFLHAGNGKYSDQRLSVLMKAVYTPWLGIELDGFDFSVRMESKTKMDMNVIASARIFSDIDAGIPFNYNSEGSLYFVPWTFELQKDIALNHQLKLKTSLSYQMWSRYVPASAIVADQSQINCQGQGTCGNSTFSASRTPEYRAKDLIVPVLGVEWKLSDHTVLGGYRYKDSIFKELPTGFGNYLDPPRHDFIVGARWIVTKNWELSSNIQVSRLVSQTVVKSNSSDIGAPGYEASGWLYGGGVQLAIPFQ